MTKQFNLTHYLMTTLLIIGSGFSWSSENDGFINLTPKQDPDTDKIVNQYDNNPDKAIERTDSLDRETRIHLSWIYSKSGDSIDTIRANEIFAIEAQGISTTPKENIVIFDASTNYNSYNGLSGTILNTPPQKVETAQNNGKNTDNKIFLKAPDVNSSTQFQIQVATRNQLSNAVRLTVNPSASPSLDKPANRDSRSKRVNETITLKGDKLGDVDTISFNGITQNPDKTSPDSLTVTIPDNARSGDLTVYSGNHQSNAIYFSVKRPIKVVAKLPKNSSFTVDELIVGFKPAYNKSFSFNKSKIATVFVPNRDHGFVTLQFPNAGDDELPHAYKAHFAPTDERVVISPRSTAISSILNRMNLGDFRKHPADLLPKITERVKAFRRIIAQTKGIDRLAKAFANQEINSILTAHQHESFSSIFRRARQNIQNKINRM